MGCLCGNRRQAAEDGPADIAAAAGNVDDPASADDAAGSPIPFERGASLQPRCLRPTITFVVVLAHAAALIAASNLSRSAPPAEDTIEVNVIAAGDEAAVTASAAQATHSAAEGQPDPKPEQTEARQDPADPWESAPPSVARERHAPPAPEPPKSPETPPPATSLGAAPPPPLPEAPPSPAASPPVGATQDPTPEPLPPQQPPTTVEGGASSSFSASSRQGSNAAAAPSQAASEA
jgi:hypothetical protein